MTIGLPIGVLVVLWLSLSAAIGYFGSRLFHHFALRALTFVAVSLSSLTISATLFIGQMNFDAGY